MVELRTSLAARRSAARLRRFRRHRLDRSHKCAQKLAVHLSGERFHIQTLFHQELARVFDPVNACRFDLDFLKSRSGELVPVFGFLESSRDASNPKQNTLPNLRRYFSSRNHIRYGKSAARLQYTKRLSQHAVLV